MTKPQYTPIRLAADVLLDSPTNPRQFYDEGALQELADSIRSQGLIQPIVARPIGNTLKHEIVCGHRRVRAARPAGLEVIDAIVKQMTDDEAATAQIHENLARRDVTPLEEAEGYDRLIRKFKVPIDKVIKDTGKSRAYIYGILSLRKLYKPGQEALAAGLPVDLAQRVASLPTEAIQRKALEDLKHVEWVNGERVATGWVSARQGKNVLAGAKYFVAIKDITFDLEAEGLGGVDIKCSDCTKRSINDPANTDGSLDVCTDVECHDAKAKGHQALQVVRLREAGHKVLEGEEAKAFSPSPYSTPTGYERLSQGLRWEDSNLVTVEDAIARLPEGSTKPTITYVAREDGSFSGYITREDSNELLKSLIADSDDGDEPDDDDDGDDDSVSASPNTPQFTPAEQVARDSWPELQTAMMRAAAQRSRTTEDLRHIAASILETVSELHPTLVELMGWSNDPAYEACEGYGDDTEFAQGKLAGLSADQLSLLLVLLAIDAGPPGDYSTLYSGRVAMAASFGVDPLTIDNPCADEPVAKAPAAEQEQLQLAGLPPPPEEDEEEEPAPAAKPAAKGGKNPPVRYRNPATGETWSGRGLQPKWLKAAIAAGNQLIDYAVEAVEA
jgi:ParB/RepB/Spo0J family partition protein